MDFHKRFILFYAFWDWVIACLVWSTFFYLRKYFLIADISMEDALFRDPRYWVGIAVIPLCWSFIFYLSGSYRPIYKQSLASILLTTFWAILFGSLGLLFLVFYDDLSLDQVPFVRSFVIFFMLALGAHSLARLSLFVIYNSLLNSGKKPLTALRVYEDDNRKRMSQDRYSIVRELALDNLSKEELLANNYHEIIIDELSLKGVKRLLRLSPYIQADTNIRVYDINDETRQSNIDFTYDLENDSLVIRLDNMKAWEQNVKRFIDITISVLALSVSFPFILIIALLLKLDSNGPIVYQQLRVGKGMQDFLIYKFRSMYVDAELDGPELSRHGDDRITRIGKIMRRYHIDEIPQFVNVIKGDMSIVGPRPERPFYVSKILSENEQLKRLYSVQPGITSWGQVKFGYASTINEILNRTRFDLLYLDNRSLYLDFRIIISTIRVVLFGNKNLNK